MTVAPMARHTPRHPRPRADADGRAQVGFGRIIVHRPLYARSTKAFGACIPRPTMRSNPMLRNIVTSYAAVGVAPHRLVALAMGRRVIHFAAYRILWRATNEIH
jgi:hypothetical protein